MLLDRLSRKAISTEINNYPSTRTLYTSSEFKIEFESDHKSSFIERVYITMYSVCVCVCVCSQIYMYSQICVCLQIYAIDDFELVRSYMTRNGASCKEITQISIRDFDTLLYARIRTSVESKRPNSVHILSETLLSFYLSYLIYR